MEHGSQQSNEVKVNTKTMKVSTKHIYELKVKFMQSQEANTESDPTFGSDSRLRI